jgi:hypothetical protein
MRMRTVTRLRPSSRLTQRSRFSSRSKVGRSGSAAAPGERVEGRSGAPPAGSESRCASASVSGDRFRVRVCRDRFVARELTVLRLSPRRRVDQRSRQSGTPNPRGASVEMRDSATGRALATHGADDDYLGST